MRPHCSCSPRAYAHGARTDQDATQLVLIVVEATHVIANLAKAPPFEVRVQHQPADKILGSILLDTGGHQQDKRSVIPIERGDVDLWLAGTVDDAKKLRKLAPVELFDAGPADGKPEDALI